jgi:hypothetical protein
MLPSLAAKPPKGEHGYRTLLMVMGGEARNLHPEPFAWSDFHRCRCRGQAAPQFRVINGEVVASTLPADLTSTPLRRRLRSAAIGWSSSPLTCCFSMAAIFDVPRAFQEIDQPGPDDPLIRLKRADVQSSIGEPWCQAGIGVVMAGSVDDGGGDGLPAQISDGGALAFDIENVILEWNALGPGESRKGVRAER